MMGWMEADGVLHTGMLTLQVTTIEDPWLLELDSYNE